MKKEIFQIIIFIFLFIWSTVFAQYNINRKVLANGGAETQNSSYKLNGTVGQSLIGFGSNSVQQNNSGFWYQVNSLITAVELTTDNLPNEFRLYQNYPNPFNPSTTIKYQIPVQVRNYKNAVTLSGVEELLVTLKIYNILGKEIASLVNKQQKPGIYEVKFNAEKLSSGMYIYRIQTNGFIQCKKLMLLK